MTEASLSTLNIVLAILLFVSAIFLIVAVLIQSGKSKGVSGAITGGASETYFGKNKSKSRDKKLSLITAIVAIVFVVLAVVAYVTQDYIDEGAYWERIFGISDDSTSSSKVPSTSSSKKPVASSDSATGSSSDDSADVPAGGTDSSVAGEGTTDSSVTGGSTADSGDNTTGSSVTDDSTANGGGDAGNTNPDNE